MKIGLIGASGRMGAEIIAAANAADASVVAGLVAKQDPLCGKTVEGMNVALSDSWDKDSSAEVIIDFSLPQGTVKAIEISKEQGIPLVVGTTGLSEETQKALSDLSKEIPVLVATNFSVGVNTLNWLVEKATSMMGEGVDIEVLDIHHRMKKDAPSGTAVTLAEHVCAARGQEYSKVVTHGRAGAEAKREDGEVGIQAFRGGGVVGEHTVYFFADGERLELSHKASDRGIFARGAVRAASWLVGKPAGMYSMKDVLGVS